ncbi:MAG: hypothetical protein HC836_10590 [Richelia sp. RM2_1_2]|nr:hypothetical protein [Richelia sp. RM2_1_2]
MDRTEIINQVSGIVADLAAAVSAYETFGRGVALKGERDAMSKVRLADFNRSVSEAKAFLKMLIREE